MRTKERGPASKQKPRTVQKRTAQTVPHKTTAAEAVLYHLIVLPVALAVIIAFCALLWLAS